MASESIILFGAGSAGRYALKHLRAQGIEPLCFADNDRAKFGTFIDGLMVTSPAQAEDEWASRDPQWVCCAISRPAAIEIRAQIKLMGVKTKPLWECIPAPHGLPPDNIRDALFPMMVDSDSMMVFNDQIVFRKNPDYDYQISPLPSNECYFPDFITHLDDEVFIDCGAASGDTIEAFIARWPKWKSIVALEPDQKNFNRLCKVGDPDNKGRITKLRMAVSDFEGEAHFEANGDWTSRLGGYKNKVRVTTLDQMLGDTVPTYIKADVEGSELELLWGARKNIAEHSPVLAICAYHKSEDLWKVPLLIHAINPEYRLHLQRYAEGAFELIWYAVPPERVK